MMPSYVPVGNEFAVNTATTGDQTAPSIAYFANGNFIVSWVTSDTTQDGSGNAIKAQIFDATGAKIGGEFLVNNLGTGSQFTESVAVLANGTFVVSWITADPLQDGSGNAVKARLFSATGTPLGGEFLVNTQTTGGQDTSNTVALAGGGFVVTWDDGNTFDQKAQIYDAVGNKVGTEFRTNTLTTNIQGFGDLTALANGGFVTIWETTDPADDGSGYAVKAQIFNASGTKVGTEFRVNTLTSGIQYQPDIAALSSGGFVAVWETLDTTQDGSNSAIKGQRFDASGNKVGSEFLVNQQAANLQMDPKVTTFANGSFFVTWATLDPAQDGSGSAIKGRVFNADGSPAANEMLINNFASGDQQLEEVVTLPDGRVLVSWVSANADGSGNAVHARFFTANTAPVIGSNGGGDTATVGANENQKAVTTVTATDFGGPLAVTYSISGGADAALFSINTVTGVLSFVTAPNFEVRTDANSDGIYDVVVRASDGELSDTQAIAVTVTNVNEPLAITSNGGGDVATLSVSENTTAVSTVTSVDPDGTAPTYAIAGGADAALFTINTATGALAFIAAPDFELPGDAGGNNVYDVIVSATDGAFVDTQAIAITVTDSAEAPVGETIVGTSGDDILIGHGGGDTIDGRGG
ncbi:MAG: hypothetical protein ABIS51_15060, partial [Sphingomonas sp.]